MTLKYSPSVRNAQLDALEVAIGASPILEIRSGAAPANTAAADTGVLLASCTLPADWMAAASAGSKVKAGTWEDLGANASGTAGHFRIKDASGTTTHIQGEIYQTGGSVTDMELDNVTIVIGQSFTVTAFTLSAGNA